MADGTKKIESMAKRIHPEYSYMAGLKDYLVKRGYRPVDTSKYPGQDSKDSFNLGNGHFVVLSDPNDPEHKLPEKQRVLTEWTEYDQLDREKKIDHGQIFDFVAKEINVKNQGRDYYQKIIPQVEKVLGSYQKYQIKTTSNKMNAYLYAENEKLGNDFEEQLKITKMAMREGVIPDQKRMIHNIETIGALYPIESIPLKIVPMDLGHTDLIPDERSRTERMRMDGLEYLHAMLSDNKDKRYVSPVFVYQQTGKNAYKGFGSHGIHGKVNEQGKSEIGELFVWYGHNQTNNKQGQQKHFLKVNRLLRVDQLEKIDPDMPDLKMDIPSYFSEKMDEEKFKKNFINTYGGCFLSTVDPKNNKERLEEALKDPVAALRKVLIERTNLKSLKYPDLQILEREMALAKAMTYLGYKGTIKIPENERHGVIKLLNEDLNGRKKRQWYMGKRVEVKEKECKYFLLGSINQDTALQTLKAISKHVNEALKNDKILEEDAKNAKNRLKFQNISIVMGSYYKDKNGQEYHKGDGGYSRKIAGEDAYLLLSDMLQHDKELYNRINLNETGEVGLGKEVRLTLNVDGKPIPLAFTPGRLDTRNMRRVTEAIIAIATREECDIAFNRNTTDAKYAEYANNRRFDSATYKSTPEDKLHFISAARKNYLQKKNELNTVLKDFSKDEDSYLKFNKPALQKELMKTADCFSYEIPTKDKELIMEAFESKNVIAIYKKDGDAEKSVVNLRKQLDAMENGFYFDSSPSHADATRSLQAIPYYTDEEKEQMLSSEKNFTLKIGYGNEEPLTYKGKLAREIIVNQMLMDRDDFEMAANEGLRSVESMKNPYHMEISYNGQVLFKEQGHYGEMKIGNYSSIEQLMKSGMESMNSEQKQALQDALTTNIPNKKYAPYKDLEDQIRSKEKVDSRSITQVNSRKMKSLEGRQNDVTKLEMLKMDAFVNHKNTEQEVSEYIKKELPRVVHDLVQEAKKNKVDNVEQHIKKLLEFDKLNDKEKQVLQKAYKKELPQRGIHR